MSGNLGIYVVFLLGILVGVILGNKDFRYKFFKGLRGFIGQLGRGARAYSKRHGGGNAGGDVAHRDIELAKPKIEHVYRRTHSSKPCPTCKESGRVFEKVSLLREGAIGLKPTSITCPTCSGEGRIWD